MSNTKKKKKAIEVIFVHRRVSFEFPLSEMDTSSGTPVMHTAKSYIIELYCTNNIQR